jgi:hypothetical protein
VLDLNGGRIGGVAYGTSAPLDRQLGDLRLPASDKTTLAEFLGALRGTRLESRNGATVITGRLLSVERKTRVSGGTTLEVDYISVITDSGEIKTTEVSPAFSVRLLERGLAGKVDRLLDLVSAGREADVRRMVISTEGAGDRSLFVSYISEVPVWKATYRIVLNSKAAGTHCCKVGPSSITPPARIGRRPSCRWSRARRSPSSRIFRSRTMRGGPWCRFRKLRSPHPRLLNRL